MKKRSEQKECRRQEIIVAALELFVSKGYAATKITDIAQKANMSTGLMFHYFESKEKLYEALVRMGVEGTQYPGAQNCEHAIDFFVKFTEELFEYMKQQPTMAKMFVLMAEAQRSDATPAQIREIAMGVNVIEQFVPIVEWGQQEGTIKDTWYKTSTVALTYETVTDNVYEGNKAAYLSGRNGIRSEAVSVLPGEIYTANTNYITQSRYMRIYLEFWNGDPKLSTSTRQSSAYIDLPKSATWADGATTQLTVPSDCMYATVTLYFANEEGNMLISEKREVEYHSNISLEKIVMEQLLLGPEKNGSYPVVNPQTDVVSVTVKDGICYLNLSRDFLTQVYNVTPDVTIYAIINSLVELANVNKVQILVEGETDVLYNEKISLNTVFERNLELVVK